MKVTENDIQELVIVGAGPAGLTASLYAHRLGIPHLLIEKTQFPKDKICGDGLAPLVFNILDELDISAKEEEIFHQIDEIEFCFSDREKSESYFGKNITKSISLNCRRLFFDNWLKNKLPADSIYYGKVTDVDYRQKHILVQHNNQIKLIRFKQLLLCNGSGKNLLTEHKHRNENNIAFASRAYITLDDAGSKNYFEFFEDIAPGYFWMFPVSKKILNTGVYFHDNSRLNNLYEIHEKKLREHLNLKEHVTYNRWPLRIFPSVQSEKTYNYVIAIGDANHSIDPLLGHGIDVAMLEAREQIIALKMSGKFTKESFIYSEIEKLGKASVKYKFILSEKHPATVRKIEFQNFLTHTATFYRTVNLYLKEHPISNILLKEDKTNNTPFIAQNDQVKQHIQTLSELGYIIVSLLNENELSDVKKTIEKFKFSFSGNQNREKIKFNSSFFESDSNLKLEFYKSMVSFFQPKIDSTFEGYDILIANYWNKNPSDGEVLVHQNWTHVDESKYRSYSIWIPLQDTNEVNGTMEVIPKSHLLFTEPRGINMEYPYESQFKAIGKEIKAEFLMPVNLKAGQAIIIDDALIHYTGANRSDNPRQAIQLVIKPKTAQGEFYFKHKNIDGSNNVEVFDADYNFYTRFSLLTGGNLRPSHGVSKKFITHKSDKMTMDKFRTIMKNSHPTNIHNKTAHVSDNALNKLSRIAARIKKLLPLN